MYIHIYLKINRHATMLLAARIAAEKEKLQTSYLHGLKQKTENKNWLTFFLSCIS